MKLKRFVAIVISLAMVLSIVPAFSLTASASSVTDVIDTIAGAEVVWTMPDTTGWSDAAITNLDGWTSNVSSGYVNLISSTDGNYIQAYGGNPNLTVNTPGYGAGTDGIILEFKFKQSGWNNGTFYHKHTFYDIDGVEIGHAWIDKNQTGFIYENPIGFPADGTKIAVVAMNNTGEGTHNTYWYVAGELKFTQEDLAGEINGFGSFSVSGGADPWYIHMGYRSLTIASYTKSASSKTITATYTAGGTTVKEVSKIIDTSSASSASFDAYYYSVNGTNTLYYAAVQTLTDSTTIAMEALENWGNYSVGDAITVDSTPYVVTGGNIVPNGDFSSGMEGWYSRANTTPPANYSVTTTDKPAGATRAAVSSGNGGGGSTNSMSRRWAITPGTTYYYSLWMKTGDAWNGFGESDSATAEASTLIAGTNTSNAWVQKTGVFTATKSYLSLHQAWASVGLADVEVYPVEIDPSKIANTTIKFVDSADGTTEIKDAVTVTGVVGDVIDLSAYSGAITYNGNPYSFDASNPTSYTVVGNTDTVTLTYTTDAYVSFEGTAVTVIQGNDPVLSTAVTAKTGAGSTTVVDGAVWESATGLSAGTHTINGTVTIDGKTINGTVTVTVLPMTFEVADLSSNGTVNFPVDVTGDFYIEYDLTASNYDNLWIYHSANGALWGSGQIGLGWDDGNAGIFRAQNGNGTSGATTITGNTFATNNTYRFLVHGNVDTDKYDFVVYDTTTKSVIANGSEYGFRTNADLINSITATNNGGGNTGAGTLSNIKVYAPDQADQFATYTVVATGSVSDTYTTTAVSVDKLTIPYYPGNIVKSRSVSGTTVTFTYEATETSLGSWAIRNNVMSQTWISEMKYLGTHNSFAYNTTVVENEGGALRNDADGFVLLETSHTVPYASSTSTTVINNSRAQTLDALDQLNAGVRYFDIRLTRQNDGTFWVFHGPAFADFRPIAATIAQWAKENPGEVVILDFHYAWDALYGTTYDVITDNDTYYGATQGDDNQYFYTALEELLTETGVMAYVPDNFNQRYGAMTGEGTKTAILTVSKGRGANCIGKFQSRDSWTSGDTAYNGDSDYDSVVSTIEAAISAGTFGSGAKWGVIHAYTTPISLGSAGDSLIDAANTNRSKWINEDLDTWMTSGYGDILLMNNVTDADITTYLARLSEYNRDYMDDQLGSEFHGETALSDEGITVTGATTSVPFSTELTVTATDNEQVITVDGVEYTTKTVYDIAFMQFDADEVELNGDVTYTFPMVSDGSTTVDALFYNNAVVATGNVGEAISYTTSNTGNFVLATRVAPGKEYTVNYVADGNTIYTKTEMVPYGQVVYSVPAGNFYLAANGEAYILNSAAAQSHTADSADTVTEFTVDVTVVSANAVLSDTFANADGSADCNDTSNQLFIGSNGVSNIPNEDADGASTTTRGDDGVVGGPRIPLLMFNIPEVADGKSVKLNIYVVDANHNINSGGSMKLAVNTTDVVVDEVLGYVAADVANQEGLVWADAKIEAPGTASNGRIAVNSWVTFDVTDFVKAATDDTITFTLYAPTAGAYAIDREKAVAGGTYQGKAAYLEVVDGYTVDVAGASKITRNGNLVSGNTVSAYEGAQIKLYETSATTPAFTNGTKVYATDNTTGETAYITVTGEDEYYAAQVGVAPIDGAQVRIGDAVDAEGKVTAESGLRFITTVDYNQSLATVAGATFGVEVTAEGSDAAAVKIVADKWQDGDAKTVFTSALTNLAVSNFNRKFTATPYVTADGQTFYGTPVTRSIYQVAAGLLNNDKDGTEYPAMADTKRLYDVLNAYVNQTGIRLTLADNALAARVEGTGAYSGNAFFEVGETTVEGTKYTVTLTPVGENTVIKDYWNEYVRINNNNSSVKVATELVANEDGTYTLTFDTANLG